jgi:hypothetical protein
MFASCKVAILCTDTFRNGYMKNKLLLSRGRQLRFRDAQQAAAQGWPQSNEFMFRVDPLVGRLQ